MRPVDSALGRTGHVRLGEDADQATLLHNGKPANLLLGHALKRRVQWVLGADEHRILRAHIGDRHLVRVEVLREHVRHQVAVGDDADELLLVHDRQRARRSPSSSPARHRPRSSSLETTVGEAVIASRTVLSGISFLLGECSRKRSRAGHG